MLETRASTNRLTEDIRNDLVDIVQECRIYVYRQYLQEARQNIPAALDTNIAPSTYPPPLSSDDSRNDYINLEVPPQPQADFEDPFNNNPEDFESIFRNDLDASLNSGFYYPGIGLISQSQCFCLGPCSCLPSSSSRNPL